MHPKDNMVREVGRRKEVLTKSPHQWLSTDLTLARDHGCKRCVGVEVSLGGRHHQEMVAPVVQLIRRATPQ